MNIDFELVEILRAITILALVAGAAWLTWKIVGIVKARGRARRMRKDRRTHRVRVAKDRRVGARREREAERKRMDAMVESMQSPSSAQPPKRQ